MAVCITTTTAAPQRPRLLCRRRAFRRLQRLCREHRGPDPEEQDILLRGLRRIAQPRSAVVTAIHRWTRGGRGDFSGLLADGKVVKNPFTGQPFKQSDSCQHDQPGLAEAARLLLPVPNCGAPGQTAGNWCGNLPSDHDFNIMDGRVDHYFSERDTVFGRYSYHLMPILTTRPFTPRRHL